MCPNPQFPADLITFTGLFFIFKISVNGSLCTQCKDMVSTAEKKKFSIKYFFSKCDQIHSFLWILSHSLKKPLMKIFLYMWALYLFHWQKQIVTWFFTWLFLSGSLLTSVSCSKLIPETHPQTFGNMFYRYI